MSERVDLEAIKPFVRYADSVAGHVDIALPAGQLSALITELEQTHAELDTVTTSYNLLSETSAANEASLERDLEQVRAEAHELKHTNCDMARLADQLRAALAESERVRAQALAELKTSQEANSILMLGNLDRYEELEQAKKIVVELREELDRQGKARREAEGELSACIEHPGGCGYWRAAAGKREQERDTLAARVRELEGQVGVMREALHLAEQQLEDDRAFHENQRRVKVWPNKAQEAVCAALSPATPTAPTLPDWPKEDWQGVAKAMNEYRPTPAQADPREAVVEAAVALAELYKCFDYSGSPEAAWADSVLEQRERALRDAVAALAASGQEEE